MHPDITRARFASFEQPPELVADWHRRGYRTEALVGPALFGRLAQFPANLAVVDSGIDHSRLSPVVAEARRWLGKNPTGRARLWCARFMNFVLERTGYAGTGSDAAKSFASYGRRISRPQYGAIAVLSRKGGGHVGVVTGVDRNGNPILIAGNNGRRQVGISVYPKRRVIAYVMPGSGEMMARRRFASAKPVPSR